MHDDDRASKARVRTTAKQASTQAWTKLEPSRAKTNMRAQARQISVNTKENRPRATRGWPRARAAVRRRRPDAAAWPVNQQIDQSTRSALGLRGAVDQGQTQRLACHNSARLSKQQNGEIEQATKQRACAVTTSNSACGANQVRWTINQPGHSCDGAGREHATKTKRSETRNKKESANQQSMQQRARSGRQQRGQDVRHGTLTH